MGTVNLKAHHDGQQIVIDEPFDLPTDSPRIVTVPSAGVGPLSRERVEWAELAVQGLTRAYGDEEPEYTLADIKERR
jgi:hypothetical protein